MRGSPRGSGRAPVVAAVVAMAAAVVLGAGARVLAEGARYTDDEKGLVQSCKDGMEAKKAGDNAKFGEWAKGMVLPDPDGWFKKVFGAELGAKLAKGYPTGEIEKLLSDLIEKGVVAKNRTEVSGFKIVSADDKEARGAQKKALEKMKEKVPLYTAQWKAAGEQKGLVLYSFVYVDGNFRLVGKLDGLE